jgi:hypothetical protein
MRVDVREIIATAEQIAVLIEVRDMLKRKTPKRGVCSLGFRVNQLLDLLVAEIG